MNPYEKELLEETNKLARENNKILRGLRSSHRWSSFFHFIYWIIIIGIVVASFYYLEPYINTALKAYSTIQNDFTNVKSAINKISSSTSALK